MLDTRITTFLKVVKAGSFSQAARQLFVSAVSVKKQMDSLESEYGVRLLDRTNRGVGPTDAGRVLYESARYVEQLSDAMIREMRAASKVARRTVRVGTSLLRPCSRLLEEWSRIGTDSDFGIEVVTFDDGSELNEVIAQLGSHVDCFLGPCDAPSWREMCNVAELGFFDCMIAVPRRHPLSGRASLTWEDLAGQALLLVKEGSSPVLDSLRHEIEDRHPEIEIVDTPDFYSIETFNECERRSILMETLDAWKNVHPGFVSLPMDWEYKVPFGLFYSKDPSAEMRLFARELVTSAGLVPSNSVTASDGYRMGASDLAIREIGVPAAPMRMSSR